MKRDGGEESPGIGSLRGGRKDDRLPILPDLRRTGLDRPLHGDGPLMGVGAGIRLYQASVDRLRATRGDAVNRFAPGTG